MRLLIAIAFLLAALPARASETFQAGIEPGLPPHAALYSFADLYRLAVADDAAAALRAAALSDPAIRVAAGPALRAREPRFAVNPLSQPSPWLLLASGLAAAVWVARRRVGYYR